MEEAALDELLVFYGLSVVEVGHGVSAVAAVEGPAAAAADQLHVKPRGRVKRAGGRGRNGPGLSCYAKSSALLRHLGAPVR